MPNWRQMLVNKSNFRPEKERSKYVLEMLCEMPRANPMNASVNNFKIGT